MLDGKENLSEEKRKQIFLSPVCDCFSILLLFLVKSCPFYCLAFRSIFDSLQLISGHNHFPKIAFINVNSYLSVVKFTSQGLDYMT